MKYRDISKNYRDVKKVPYDDTDGTKNDPYWTALEGFKVRLREALDDTELLRKLTKPQLLQVMAWCESYRPVEPHYVLRILGKLAG